MAFSNGEPGESQRIARRIAVIGLIGAFAASLGLWIPNAARAATDPMVVTKSLVDDALGVLNNKQMPTAQKREALRKLVALQFDFTEMSRSALGYHWRTLTPTQRTAFTDVFTEFIEDAYLNKIQDYSGQTVKFVKQRIDSGGYAQVDTKIIQTNGSPPIPVNYLLLKQNGQWKIYDVTVEAISIVSNYRNQFNRVINDQGFDKLMSELRKKRNELATSLGESK